MYDFITVHCSATQCLDEIDAKMIGGWHRKRNFNEIGYHFVIKKNGVIEKGRDLSKIGAHVKGHNMRNIGICMVGGVDENNKSVANFTPLQINNLRKLINCLKTTFFILDKNIIGHRDWSPDLNKNGKIESNEWLKDCPCFDVQKFIKGFK